MSAVPATRTVVLTRSGLRTQTRARAKSNVATIGFAFLTIAAAAYVAGTLGGQVLMERARRQSLWSMARAQDARQAEAVLQRQVDAMTSLSAIQNWAKANGFVAPDSPISSSEGVSRVASRR